jgi:hypothetical protein
MMPLLEQPDFVDRNNFANFLNRRGLVGEAVEVGTHRAEFANIFLRNWKGKLLTCVDPYLLLPGYERQHLQLNHSDGDREKDKEVAFQTLRPHMVNGSRARFIYLTSLEAAEEFEDGRPGLGLDFVYIDADHREEQVYTDLVCWWPKIKPGGILAGHDFLSHHPDSDHHGVQPALFRFCMDKGIKQVFMVTETLCMPWSFLIEKPK